jgi:hypothetical protein
MKRAFAQESVLAMDPTTDSGAPGAAITVALCGHWEHDGPCPLAPHATAVHRVRDQVVVRTLFAAEPTDEAEVRRRIGQALTDGALVGPDGSTASWQLLSTGPSAVAADETDHAARLVRGPPA